MEVMIHFMITQNIVADMVMGFLSGIMMNTQYSHKNTFWKLGKKRDEYAIVNHRRAPINRGTP